MSITTSFVISDTGLITIGSATEIGGLRTRISEHLDSPGRLERAALECACGFNDLAVCWAETPDPQTAVAHEAALLGLCVVQNGYLPSLRSLAALEITGPLPTQEEAAALAWSSLYALHESNMLNIPEGYGVYAISAGQPVDREMWNPPRGEMRLYACPFADLEPSCRRRSGVSCGATGAPKMRRRRLRRRLEDFLE